MSIRLFIGPCAAGKDTQLQKWIDLGKKPIISTTTRPPRESETEGKDYHFVTNYGFEEMIKNNKLVEYVERSMVIDGEDKKIYYGSPKVDPTKGYVAVVDIEGAKKFIDVYGSENIGITIVDVPEGIRKKSNTKR